MHRFDRGEPPRCLVAAQRRRPQWDDFSRTDDHKQLGDALYERQEHYCAYCEVCLGEKTDGHIEHLERRKDNPARTFDWDNLFFSCNHLDSCGKHKDGKRLCFNPSDVIDPAHEDPLDFLRYDMNGGVHAIAGDPARQRRAEETIRVFNLNAPRLRNIRRQIAQTIYSLDSELRTDEDCQAFLGMLQNVDCPSVYRSLLAGVGEGTKEGGQNDAGLGAGPRKT